jgi:enamine deaminase RidA (YjgF/YER057c/UK114 family)
VVPVGAELVFVAGQVGMSPDGTVPSGFAEQAELTFRNVRVCLAAHGLGVEHVVKLSGFLLPGQDFALLREVRETAFRRIDRLDDRVRAAAREPEILARGRSCGREALEICRSLTRLNRRCRAGRRS